MGKVYFIKESSTNYIKIGKTENKLSERLADLQTANPRTLYFIGYIKIDNSNNLNDLENKLHKKFEHLKNNNGGEEWFNDQNGEIVKFLCDNNYNLDYYIENKIQIGKDDFKSLQLSWFIKNRKEQFNFALNEIVKNINQKNFIITAQVKVGKREITEILSLLLPKYKHIYLTGLSRCDTKDQIDELNRQYGIDTFVINKKNQHREIIKKLNDYKDYEGIICHFDEADYATESSGKLKKIFSFLLEDNKIKICYYSATNEEISFSEIKDQKNTVHCNDFIPSSDYHGAGWFLDNNLQIDPEPIYNIESNDFSDQFKDILKNCDKPIVVVRGLYKINEKDSLYRYLENNKQHIINKLKDYKFEIKFVGDKIKFNWGGKNENGYVDNELSGIIYKYEKENIKTLIILNQTCSRSTELKIHKYIYAWHDYRTESTNFNTGIQAFGRPFHYKFEYKIKLYVPGEYLKLAAKEISYNDFKNLSSRINSFNNSTNKYDYFYNVISKNSEEETIKCVKEEIEKLKKEYNINFEFNKKPNDSGIYTTYWRNKSNLQIIVKDCGSVQFNSDYKLLENSLFKKVTINEEDSNIMVDDFGVLKSAKNSEGKFTLRHHPFYFNNKLCWIICKYIEKDNYSESKKIKHATANNSVYCVNKIKQIDVLNVPKIPNKLI